jgi:hypothetical protein
MMNLSIPWEVSYYSSHNQWESLGALATTTEKLEFSSSVTSLFAFGEWLFMGNPTLMENKIVVQGTKLRFVFTDGLDITTIYMNILSVANGPGVSGHMTGETYNLTLISPWYFEQICSSSAYYGTVGSIIGEIVTKELAGTLRTVHISTTFDNNQSVYYRTMMTQSKFFSSILDYGIGQNRKAIYTFTTPENDFYLMDYTLPTDNTLLTAIDLAHPDFPAYQQQIDTEKSKFIFPTAITASFNENQGQAENAWLEAGASLAFLQPLQGIVKTRTELPRLSPLADDLPNPFSFMKNRSNPNATTKVYLDDSLQEPQSILNIALNKHSKELLKSHKIVLYCYPNMRVRPGMFCKICMINGATGKESLLAQTLMVSDVTHIFSKLKGKLMVTLSAPSLSYTSVEKVTDLYHPQSQ